MWVTYWVMWWVTWLVTWAKPPTCKLDRSIWTARNYSAEKKKKEKKEKQEKVPVILSDNNRRLNVTLRHQHNLRAVKASSLKKPWFVYLTFKSPLWLGIGVKTSNIKMMIVFNTCFTEAWRWSNLNIHYKVHPNLMAICSTGHKGADGILLGTNRPQSGKFSCCLVTHCCRGVNSWFNTQTVT